MAGTSKSKSAAPEKVKLVGPDGQEREVVVGSNQEVSLRFDGYLPPDQAKLEAPERPKGASPKTVGTGSVSEPVPTPEP
jgi:hypothetical protein